MNVFIVDDEFLQRQLVKKTVNWEKLGLEIAGEAEDGEEALDKILEEKPDILIMDINIPYVNGIQVSEKVKQVLPDTQVIILTAYGEFEYAKQALSLEAASFVLKPVNPEELTEELIKCKEKLEKIHHQNNSFQKMREEINQHQKEQYLLERLSGIGGMEKEERIRQILGIRKPVCYVVLLLRFRDKEGKEKQLEEIGDMMQDYFPEYECLEINQQDAVFLLYGENQMEYQVQLLGGYLQEEMNQSAVFWGGASQPRTAFTELKEAYQEAYSAGRKGRKQKKIHIFEPMDMTTFLGIISYESETINSLLKKRSYQEYMECVEACFDRMKQENVIQQAAYYVAMDILVHFSLYLAEMGIDVGTQVEVDQRALAKLQDYGSTEEIRDILRMILERGRRLLESHKVPATRKKVSDAKEFIDQNFSRFDMSLNLVADAIGVNASYLSNIFKKEQGCSLSKYITSVRLEEARKMIRKYPDKTLLQISEEVGYGDVYYFSKSFKNQYGITPSKYFEESK